MIPGARDTRQVTRRDCDLLGLRPAGTKVVPAPPATSIPRAVTVLGALLQPLPAWEGGGITDWCWFNGTLILKEP